MSHIVVGGGIAGILAAILLKQKSPLEQVTLIEQNDSCGGLLRSIELESGDQFDYGTHIVSETANPELNKILFKNLNSDDWLKLPILKPGNFFAGELYKYSQLLHIASMSKEKLAPLVYDFLNANRSSDIDSFDNLEEYLEDTYGTEITNVVFRPLMKKLMGADLANLHADAHRLFGYERLILGSETMMRELKEIPVFDKLLAFKSYLEGVSSLNNFYPKHGNGIGEWIKGLIIQASELGVTIETSAKISNISVKSGQVQAITINDENTIPCNQLIWTIPPFLLLKLSNESFFSAYRPTLRALSLHHFVIDRPFLTHNFHIYCNDPNMLSFRITLYSNISENEELSNGNYRFTVEVLTDDTSDLEKLADTVWQEMKTMKIIDPATKIIHQLHQENSSGFPVYTNELVNEMRRQADFINESLSNVKLLGKASTNSFFMGDVLTDVYNELR